MLFCVVARSLLGLPGSAGSSPCIAILIYMVLEYSSTTMVLSTAIQPVEALIVQHITNLAAQAKVETETHF